MAEDKITAFIVDDHAIVRQGLRTLLALMGDIEVVGEAVNGRQAVDLSNQLHPDVVLMDLVMPEMDGITATQLIHKADPHIKIIALTSFLEDNKVIPAIQAGATSVLLKDVSPEDLVEAIRAAYRDESRLTSGAARKLMNQVAEQPVKKGIEAADITDREWEVLQLVAQGMNNKKIAEKLVISEKTVKTHVSSLLGKMGFNDRTQLAVHAIRQGWVKEGDL